MSDGERVIGIDNHVYYGICTSAANVSEKIVVIQNPTLILEDETYKLDLNEGDQLNVSFSQRNEASNPQLALRIKEAGSQELVDIGTYINSGRVVIDGQAGPSLADYWESGDIISFTYVINTSGNTGYWVINNFGVASENRFGTVKLADSEDTVDETDERLAASIPKIKSLILSDINKLGLSIDRSAWVIKLTYDGNDLSGGNFDKQAIPLRTSSFINDGPPDTDGASYIYKTSSNNINQGGATLNIGTVNATTLKGSLAGSYITDGSIGSGKLGSNAVTTVKIANKNVTTDKLADLAVTTIKIANGNVTDAKLASGIDAAKITKGKMSTNQIANLDTYIKNIIKGNVFVQHFSADVEVNAKSQMVRLQTANKIGTLDSGYSAHLSIAKSGFKPIGVVGYYFSIISGKTMMGNPSFQDCYISENNLYFHVQTNSNTAGWSRVGFYVLYRNN